MMGEFLAVLSAIAASFSGWYFDERPALSVLLFAEAWVCYMVGERMMEG